MMNSHWAVRRISHIVLLVATGALAVWLGAAQAAVNNGAQGGARHALVVGNADYKFAPALSNSSNDSRDICAALKKLGYQATCAVDVKTRGAFRDLVSNFVQSVKKGDVILFYFAGHGIEMDGENYLVPTASEFRSRGAFEDQAIRLNYILDELAGTGSRLSVIILDACRDNPFGAKSRSAVGRGLAVPDRAPAGSVIIFPTSPGKFAQDGAGDSRNGLFTKHLLAHMRTPGIELEAMFKRVIEGVKTESEKSGMPQIPWMNMSFTGEYCFAGCLDREADAREKVLLASRTRELEAQLVLQQQQSDEFRTKMKEMEARLTSQQQSTAQNSPEFKRLEAERTELAKKVAMLENQDQGLRKAQQSLSTFRNSEGELARIEQDLSVQQRRLKELDTQLGTNRSTKNDSSQKVAELRKERDELRLLVKGLLAQKKRLENAEAELVIVARVTKESEQLNKELSQYRDRLASLEQKAKEREGQLSKERTLRVEVEEKLKDAKKEAVRGAAVVAPAF